MGKKKIAKVEDFKGLRIRVTGEAGKLLAEFGAVPTLVPGPEMYTALDKGMIDGISTAWTEAFYNFKVYEVSKYATNKLNVGTISSLWAVNIDAWNKLPPEWQKLGLQLREAMINEYVKENAAEDDKNIPVFKKAGVEIIEFPAGERAKLLAVADKYWKAWVGDMEKKGLPGKAVFEFAQAKIKELEKK